MSESSANATERPPQKQPQPAVESKMRPLAVATSPIRAPLVPALFKSEEVTNFGCDVRLQLAGQPEEAAPSFFFLASSDSSYMTGQTLQPNGCEVVNA